MKIAISAESAVDLPKELLQKYDIKTTPFTVLLGDRLVYDGEIELEEMFDYVAKTKVLPKTSAVNEHQFVEHFENLLKQNDTVIHFSLSSKASCAYNNAVSASKKFKSVYVVDSKNLSTGIALLAIKASEMAKKGKGAEEILNAVTQCVPKVQTSLIVNKLDYLKKGGRCSGIVCFGANLLQIHPQIILKDGKLYPAKKYRGNFEKCVKHYCEDTLKEFNNFDKSLAFLMYTSASELAINNAKESLKNAGFKEIIEAKTGATITSHCGPNSLGIIYMLK